MLNFRAGPTQTYYLAPMPMRQMCIDLRTKRKRAKFYRPLQTRQCSESPKICLCNLRMWSHDGKTVAVKSADRIRPWCRVSWSVKIWNLRGSNKSRCEISWSRQLILRHLTPYQLIASPGSCGCSYVSHLLLVAFLPLSHHGIHMVTQTPMICFRFRIATVQ